MRPELFEIACPTPGRLATMAHPRAGDRLEDELRGLADAGVTVLVSLLTESEELGLGLEPEERLAAEAGIEFLRLRTPDMTAPNRAATTKLADTLLDRLRLGGFAAVHCRAGIGRSSAVAAAVLVRAGQTPDEAFAAITRARGLQVPETTDQRRLVEDIVGDDPERRSDEEPG